MKGIDKTALIDRAASYEPGGRGFKSCRARQTLQRVASRSPLFISGEPRLSAEVGVVCSHLLSFRRGGRLVWNDIAQLFGAILVVVGAVLPIVNPPGDASLFLNLTAGCDEATRRNIARRIAVYSFGLLLGSMLIGPLLLRLFDLSVAVIQVAGGAVVIALGWNLLNEEPRPSVVGVDAHQASITAMAHAFYPLTMPLTVDPGAMSVAVTIGANHAHTLDRLLIQLLAAVIGAAIVALAILLTYRYAERFAQRIGREGMNIVLRLSAFIVLSIGVQIAWNGIKVLLQESGVAA